MTTGTWLTMGDAPVLHVRRCRLEDLEVLAGHFIDELTSGRVTRTLPDDFLARAKRHAWPGNVRELRNAVQQALTAPDLLAIGDGQPRSLWSIDTSVPFKLARQRFVDEFDRRFMMTLLEEHRWNISAAARATGVDRMSVYKLLERLGSSAAAPARRATRTPPDDAARMAAERGRRPIRACVEPDRQGVGTRPEPPRLS